MKYVGPLDRASGAKLLRSMPYLMSLVVIGVPSWYFRPERMWYVQVLASALGWPRPVARSGTTVSPSLPAAGLKVSRVRAYRREKFCTQP